MPQYTKTIRSTRGFDAYTLFDVQSELMMGCSPRECTFILCALRRRCSRFTPCSAICMPEYLQTLANLQGDQVPVSVIQPVEDLLPTAPNAAFAPLNTIDSWIIGGWKSVVA
jgi:hypothetical protein